MAKTTSVLILRVIRKFELMLTRRAVNMLGGGRSALSECFSSLVLASRISERFRLQVLPQ